MRALFIALVVAASIPGLSAAWIDGWRLQNPIWRGAHVLVRNPAFVRDLEASLPALTNAGLNVLVVQIDYGLAFDQHPEVRGTGFLSKAEAHHLTEACHANGIRLIPQFSCLGHQSWSSNTGPLLVHHPEFDETPGQFPENKGIYCRSWCPQAPGLAPFVRDLMDEMIDAFDADALHVGMDEVFLLASEHCPRCKGGDPAKLFAGEVNRLHAQVVGRRKCEMLMWADRFLDASGTGYGEWEAAKNGTAPAVDLIPKDIILCDWHYEPLDKYPGKPDRYKSLPLLLEKGFRVWPSTWRNPKSATAFSEEARALKDPRMLGTLVTTWGAVKPAGLADWEPLRAGFSVWPK